MSAYSTDFAALGLPYQSPFDVLKTIRKAPAEHRTPKKRGPKPKVVESKKIRDSFDSRMAALLKPPRHLPFHPAPPTEADLAHRARLTGKSAPNGTSR